MYQLSENENIVINLDDNSSFDKNSNNLLAIVYQQWLLEGNTPLPYIPITVIPTEVSMSQAREALLQVGLLASINTAVSQLSEKAQIQWEYRATIQRDNQFVQELVTSNLLTNEQLDELFTLAASL